MLRRALRSALLASLALAVAPGSASALVDASQGQRAGGWWGGTYTVSTGEQVRVLLSDSYPADEARAQHWAETLAQLVHGPELSRLTAHFAPIDEVRRLCGPSAAGCYSPTDQSLLVPGESLPGLSAESVLAHEYGHHVANNRANPPWNGLDWGPKRWASYQRICPRARAGTAFPGTPARYRLQPGEAFAEAYRVFIETRAGAVDFSWSIVDGSFRPDASALKVVEQDVLRPWEPTTLVLRGRPGRRAGGIHERLLALPYDGVLAARVTPRAHRLQVVDPFSGRVLARGGSLSRTICGERSLLLRVVGDGRHGPFTVRITRP
jgi:hypothetical protein